MNIDDYEASLQGKSDEADIETAIKNAPPEPESVEPPTIEEPPAAEHPAAESPKVEETPTHAEPPAEPEKRVQTPEENARFAEERRQQQAEKRAAEALEKLKKEDPAFQTAKILEELYGAPISQIQAQLEQARLQKIAERQNISVEAVQQIEHEKASVAQARQEAEAAKQELIKTQFEQWNTRMELEGQKLQAQYPMLSADDLKAASLYMIETLKNPELPLENAVYAVHGKKISAAIQQAAKTEALAEISGRSNTPLPPQGGKPAEVNTLTADEKYVAKMMGISEEEYLKYK